MLSSLRRSKFYRIIIFLLFLLLFAVAYKVFVEKVDLIFDWQYIQPLATDIPIASERQSPTPVVTELPEISASASATPL